MAYEAADMAFEAPAKLSRSAPAPIPDEPGTEPMGGQMLAYTYDATVTLPSGAVGDVMTAHREACQAAGSATCQVLSASVYGQDEERVSASLSFRAAPAYLAGFRASLAGDAAEAGGRLTAEQQRVENLTRQITDLSARLGAQETLRDRLIALLERSDGEVGELLQVERELARVQGEIESMVSQLRYLEGRVSMSLMTVQYEPTIEAFSPGKRQPLLDAFRDFFGILAESLAGFIRFVALALPWLVIGLPVLWLILRRFRRRRT
jgi:hypothetical protein